MGNALASEAAGILHVESDEELRRPLAEELRDDATPNAAARKVTQGETGWAARLWCHVACTTCCQLVRCPRAKEPGAPEETRRPARVVLWVGQLGLDEMPLLERARRGRDEGTRGPAAQRTAEGLWVDDIVVRGSQLRVYDLGGGTPASWKRYLGQANAITYVVDAHKSPAALAEALLQLRDLLRDNLVSRFVPLLVLGHLADDEAGAPRSGLDQPAVERVVRDVMERFLPYAWAVFLVSASQGRGLTPALEWLAESTKA